MTNENVADIDPVTMGMTTPALVMKKLLPKSSVIGVDSWDMMIINNRGINLRKLNFDT